jgi:NAD(P)-dependent dehydrogenase (short-subunit alcohol dehydrogenase family)
VYIVKHVVVTGANAGLGFQTALKLAGGGAKVVMACRNMEKGQAALNQILERVPGADLLLLRLDVSDLDSVREFSQDFSRQVGSLDVLINNAGIVAIPLTRNGAGHELQLATNYLGAFALTGMLLPLFRRERPARIVNVGSLAHRFGTLDINDLNWEQTPYDQWKAYARSKLAMLSFTMQLSRCLRKMSSNITALAAHPGFAATEIHKKSEALAPKNAFSKWLQEKVTPLVPSAVDAARPIILAASADPVSGGEYYGPGGFLEIGGRPSKARVNPVANDIGVGKRLWAVSESMTGVHYLSDL